jgi:hypothetical protein
MRAIYSRVVLTQSILNEYTYVAGGRRFTPNLSVVDQFTKISRLFKAVTSSEERQCIHQK